MIKYKNKKGEEIEIEETDVIKAIQEEYEKKLKEKEAEITALTDKNEKDKENLRQEHVKQLRAVLSGRTTVTEQKEFEEEEIDEEEALVKEAREQLKNLL